MEKLRLPPKTKEAIKDKIKNTVAQAKELIKSLRAKPRLNLNLKPSKRFRKYFILILIVMMVGAIQPTDAANEYRRNNPAVQNLLGVLTADQAEAIYGNKYCNGTGAIVSAVDDTFNYLLNGISYCSANGLAEDVIESSGATVPNDRLPDIGVLSNLKLGGINNMVIQASGTILNQHPTSAIAFFSQGADQIINPGKVAAQTTPQPYFPGQGWAMLQPIQAFWGWAANIAFSFMIVIIVGVAFALMFRSSLGGQEAVKLQTAIPGIVMAMILIPLSYPISGLFFDGMTIASNVVHDFLLGNGGPGSYVYEKGDGAGFDDADGNNEYQFEPGGSFGDNGERGLYIDDPRLNPLNVFQLIQSNKLGAVFGTGADSICSDKSTNTTPWGTTYTTYACFDNPALVIYSVVNFIISAIGGFLGHGDATLATVAGAIVSFFIGIVMFFSGLKITWRLAKKYMILLLAPIMSPFIAMTVAIPGQGTKSFIQYLQTLASAVAFYVVTYAVFIGVIIIANPAFHQTIPAAGITSFKPPLIANILVSTANTAGSVAVAEIGLILQILALILFYSLPDYLDKIDSYFKQTKGLPEFLKPALNEFKSTSGLAYNTISGVSSGVLNSNASKYLNPFNIRSGAAFGRTLGGSGVEILKGAAGMPRGIPFVGDRLAAGAAKGLNYAGKLLTGDDKAILATKEKPFDFAMSVYSQYGGTGTMKFELKKIPFPAGSTSKTTVSGSLAITPPSDLNIPGFLIVETQKESTYKAGELLLQGFGKETIGSKSYDVIATFKDPHKGVKILADGLKHSDVGRGIPLIIHIPNGVPTGLRFTSKDDVKAIVKADKGGQSKTATAAVSFDLVD